MKSTVKDVMTKRVVAVSESAPFKDIVRLMEAYRVSALPVLDQSQRLVGIVSEADLLLKEEFAREQGEDPPRFERRRIRAARAKATGLVARAVMTSPVVTIGPDDTVAEAARRIHAKGIKRLPVVDGTGKVLGIVSRVDLLKVFLRSDEEIRAEVVNEVICRTLWLDPDSIKVDVRSGVVTLEGTIERKSLIPVLVRMVSEVDGVVGIEKRLNPQIDDTIPPEIVTPWAFFPSPVPRG